MSQEDYELIFEGVKPVISLPGFLPEISILIFSFLNPMSLALSKLNKGSSTSSLEVDNSLHIYLISTFFIIFIFFHPIYLSYKYIHYL
jgi:hypothetical protein